MHFHSNIQVISTLGDISMQTLSPHVFTLVFLLLRKKGGEATENWGVTEVEGEVEAKAAAKGKEQEGSSLRADCSRCSPAVHPVGRRLALTGICVPERGSGENTNFCQQHLICFFWGVTGAWHSRTIFSFIFKIKPKAKKKNIATCLFNVSISN